MLSRQWDELPLAQHALIESTSGLRGSGEKRERFHENRRDSNDRENGNEERKGMGKGRECRMKLTKLKYKLNI